MHEFSIASQMMETVLRIAGEHDAVRVTEVEVVCGEMQQVVEEALTMAFAAVATDTLAAGARLIVTPEPLKAACRACGQHYRPAIDDYRCPGCGAAQAELLAGRDIVLKTVVCETPSEAGV